MGSPGRTTALLGLSLILLLRSQGPGVQGQEFRFGPCRVQGVALRELREAFWTVKDTVAISAQPFLGPPLVPLASEISDCMDLGVSVCLQGGSLCCPSSWTHLCSLSPKQAKDNITSVRLLRKEVLQDVSDAESCYLIRALLKFYLNTVFKNYLDEAADVRIRRSFSTLANNFFVIASKLQPSQEDEMFSISESARRRFLLFQRAFKQLDIQAAQTKAFGEVDILLTWMEKFYEF